jgi:hypothetical protein
VIGDTREHVGEPGARIDVVQVRGGDQRIHRGRSLAAPIRTTEQPRLATEGDAPERPLCRVVRQADPPVVEESGERVPALQHVVHRFRDIGMPGEFGAFAAHPLLESGDERSDSDLPRAMTLSCREAVDVALDVEDRIDPTHRFDRERRLGKIGEDEQLAPFMRPARGLGDRPRFTRRVIELVEPGISIRLQDAGVACEMTARMLAATIP